MRLVVVVVVLAWHGGGKVRRLGIETGPGAGLLLQSLLGPKKDAAVPRSPLGPSKPFLMA